jgi:tetratricopeptide (TPR) repeat protein
MRPTASSSLRRRIEERRQRVYVGRRAEVASFEEALRLPPDDERRPFVFDIFGQGGVGKSSLARQFLLHAEQASAVTTFVDEAQDDLLTTMATMAEQIMKQGHDAREFVDRHQRYEQKRAELETDPEAHSFATFLGTAGRAGVVLGRRIPVGGILLDLVDEEAAGKVVEKTAAEFAAFIAKKVSDKNDRRLLQEPVAVLTPILLRALRRVAQRQPVMLFFDTYERTGEHVDAWLRDVLDERYGEVLDNILIVIAGREQLSRSTWEPYEQVIVRLELQPFTPEEAREYLVRRGVDDERIIAEILELSGGLPLLLATLVSGNPTDASQLDAPYGTAVERFLRWIPNRSLQTVALHSALPRSLNQNVVAVLVGADKAEAHFAWLRTLPFVKERRDDWVYHELVRVQMLRHKRREAPQDWAELHGRLAAYFAESQRNLGLAEAELHGNADWRAFRLEELYHRLCEAPYRHRGEALSGFLTFLSTSRSFSRRWAESVRQAGIDASAADLEAAGAKLIELVQAVVLGEHEKAIHSLTVLLNDYGLDTMGRAMALDWRGYLYGLLQRPDKALVDLDEAVRLMPGEAEFSIDRGLVNYVTSRYEEALTDLGRALELGARQARVFLMRAEIFKQLERYEEAVADLEQHLELEPGATVGLVSRAEVYLATGRTEDALADLDEAVRRAPDEAELLAERSRAYLIVGRLDQALQDADRTIELEPNNLVLLSLRAEILRRRGDTAEFSEATELIRRQSSAFVDQIANYLANMPPHAVDRRVAFYASSAGVDVDDYRRLIDLVRDDREVAARVLQAEAAAVQATAAYRRGDLDGAVEGWTAALELDPSNANYLHARSQTFAVLNRHHDALADLDRAVELEPRKWRLRAARGDVRRTVGQPEAACADFDEAVALAQGAAQPLGLRGRNYLLMGRIEEALQDFDQALELEPGNLSIISMRMAALQSRQDAFGAAAAAGEIAGQARAFVDLFRRSLTGLPDTLLQQRIEEWASTSGANIVLASRFAAAARDDPDLAVRLLQAEAAGARAAALLQQELAEGALDELEAALELDPGNPLFWFLRGQALRQTGRPEDALADLDQALTLDPSLTTALQERAELHLEHDRIEDALADLDKAIALQPEDAYLRFLRGNAYLQTGSANEALADLTRSLELAPEEDWLHYSRARAHLTVGAREQAEADLRAAIRRVGEIMADAPRLPHDALNLALYHLLAGEVETAEELYRRALASVRSPAELREALDDLEDLKTAGQLPPGAERIEALLRSQPHE